MKNTLDSPLTNEELLNIKQDVQDRFGPCDEDFLWLEVMKTVSEMSSIKTLEILSMTSYNYDDDDYDLDLNDTMYDVEYE